MNVKLVSSTKSLIEGIELSAEELIVYTARVSNPENQMNKESSDRLIKYLIKNKHWSPLEMCDVTVEIKTSRAIAAQILRHRSFSFQEFSQRYSEVNKMEDVQLRKAGSTNRQSSLEVFDPNLDGNPISASRLIDAHIKQGVRLYNSLLKEGVAKECARMILPLNTQTTIYMTGTLRSWLHYLDLRCAQSTQKEHRDIAVEINNTLKDIFPQTFSALDQQVSH